MVSFPYLCEINIRFFRKTYAYFGVESALALFLFPSKVGLFVKDSLVERNPVVLVCHL